MKGFGVGSVASSKSSDGAVDEDGRSRPLKAPRCVATANGWIVTVLEAPGLRLVSRWNVRRSSGGAEHILPIPPPLRGTTTDMARIAHIFCDPTGCHTFLSARNGEAYYLHSTTRQIQKLAGFGPDTATAGLTGVSATARKPETTMPAIQQGLTAGSFVTTVAWDRERGTEGFTKVILLGTNFGELYEYALTSPSAATESNDELNESPKLPILLHKLHSQSSELEIAAVSGLYFERTTSVVSNGMIILAATCGRNKRTRLFSFYAAMTNFRDVLTKSTNQPTEAAHSSLLELPGSIDYCQLHLCNDQFALRTATGIYYGRLDRGNAAPSPTTGIIVDAGMMVYGSDILPELPVSIALTPHHLITLGETMEVRFINRVAQKVIQKERVDWISSQNLDESSLAVGELLMDIRRPDQVWLRKARTLVHISSSAEDRDVWKFTLQKCLEMPTNRSRVTADYRSSGLSEEEKTQEALFAHAKSLCSNSTQKAVVTVVRAEYHLSQGRAELAAKYLAQCPPALAPFCDTSIRLALPMLGINDANGFSVKAKASLAGSDMALISYLSDKMSMGKLNDDSVTCTMIGAWLTELYLHERERGQQKHLALLHPFLSSHVNNMDAKTIMRILSSHDVSAAECADFASSSGDLGSAVNAALCVGSDDMAGAHDALRILNDATFEMSEPFYYKHATTLLARAPLAASKSFLSRYSQGLSPTKLLPSIMHYERKRKEWKTSLILHPETAIEKHVEARALDSLKVEGSKSLGDGVEIHIANTPPKSAVPFVDDDAASFKYLEGVIKLGCRSSAVFSYLISLYAAMEDEEPLLKFLISQVPAAASVTNATTRAVLDGMSQNDEGISSPLDMSYALRTILETGRHFRSAIKLYMGFGLRQQAVELALKVDPSLARDMAREATDDQERQRLWLMIARNAAGDNRGSKDVVAKVVAVLKDCGPDVLSIEDVLPFLPDFAQIDQIKDEICDALTSYSSKIEVFLKDMNECDQTCDALREEIGRLSSHRMQMKADARCALTNSLVLNAGEPFYVFPSGYVFLESALKEEVMPYLNDRQRNRVDEIQKEMARLASKTTNDSPQIDALQAELDGLIAAECPLTGSIMVDSIDRGFEDSIEADESYNNMRDGNDQSVLSESGFVGVNQNDATSREYLDQ